MSWNICNQFLVKEHVGFFKAANNYDIFGLESGQKLLECREEKLGIITKMLRFTDYKRMTPFDIQIRDNTGELIIEVKRGISIFLSKVEVFDGQGNYLGGFKQKLFSVGGKFAVHDELGDEACMLQGKWTGWNFSFSKNGTELAHVTKKWAGIGKELLTTADNYVLDITEEAGSNEKLKKLIIAAVMCIDMVLKE
jgi:uncharacterized protein YxjI